MLTQEAIEMLEEHDKASFVPEKAKLLARIAHRGQTRWNGDEYFTHPERVAKSFYMDGGSYEMAVAFLHDVVEDTDVTIHDLAIYFPYPVVDAVAAITKQKGKETYTEYIKRLLKNNIATRVKIADLEDNMSDLKPGNLKEKYMITHYLLTEKLRENG